jgi:hypothetical protein
VAGLLQRSAVRLAVYRGARPARLWRSVCCAVALIAVVLPGSGCSTSYPIGSQKEQKEEDKLFHTGSVAASSSQQPVNEEVQLPPDADLAVAKVALSEVLTRGGADASIPWENPKSGARGTITPLANSYRMEGALCRDFLASYVSDGSESWMQGEACRVRLGKWEVRRLKPWRRT